MNLGKAQEALGTVIRNHRQAMELSQDAFAASIGMHRAYYWNIEHGRRNLSLRILVRVAAGLRTSVWQLLKEEEI